MCFQYVHAQLFFYVLVSQSIPCNHGNELHTCAVFFETSKFHKYRFSSLMLINLSCLPDGHQRILFGGEYLVRNTNQCIKFKGFNKHMVNRKLLKINYYA